MNIIVRNMIYADIEDLPRAFAAQGWTLPASVFEQHYSRVCRRFSDMLIAEVKGQPAGFVRLEWVDAGEEADHALVPEVEEFIVLNRYAASGVAEAMAAELERRVASKTGEVTENALLAIYSSPPMRALGKCSYVLDGLLVGAEGKFIRTRGGRQTGAVIRMNSVRKI